MTGFYVVEDSFRPGGPSFVLAYIAATMANDGTFTARDLANNIGRNALTEEELLARPDGLAVLEAWNRGDHSALEESDRWAAALSTASDASTVDGGPDARLDYWRQHCAEQGIPEPLIQDVWRSEGFWAELTGSRWAYLGDVDGR